MRIRVALPAFLAALAAVAIALVFTVFHGTSSASTGKAGVGLVEMPVDVSGHWRQSQSGIPGAVMDAHISDGKIRIDVTMSGSTTGLYWQGTFDTGNSTVSNFSVTSQGDTAAMAGSMYGSLDSTKTFSYNNGDLSFPYSIMGVSTVVHLTRS